jgi:hypothetical protein
MCTQIVMDRSGDTRHEFDPTDAAAVRKAEARFHKLIGRGFRAVALGEQGAPNKLVGAFDPDINRTLFIPQLQGG